MGTFNKTHVKLLIEHSREIIPEEALKSMERILELNVAQEGNDIAKVKCVFCGALHEVSDMEVDFYDGRDAQKVFEFHKKCQCGKHLAGERIDNYLKVDDRYIPSHREVTFKNCTNQNSVNWQNEDTHQERIP